MNFEDLFSAGQVRSVNCDVAIKSSGAHQCWIQRINTICPCENNDILCRPESIHFHEDLVECLFALVIPRSELAPIARFTDRVDFVDEDYGGLIFAGLSE